MDNREMNLGFIELLSDNRYKINYKCYKSLFFFLFCQKKHL